MSLNYVGLHTKKTRDRFDDVIQGTAFTCKSKLTVLFGVTIAAYQKLSVKANYFYVTPVIYRTRHIRIIRNKKNAVICYILSHTFCLN